MAKKKSASFEEAFLRLEQIVDIMGKENTTLDESLKLYKEGVDLSVFLDNSLKNAQKDVLILKNQTLALFNEYEDGEEIENE